MELRVCVFLAVAVVGVLSEKCAPPNDACECSSAAIMRCPNAAKFPDYLPDSVTFLWLDNCAQGFGLDLPADLNYTNLETLHVIGCRLQNLLPGAFAGMPKLRELDISSNDLTIINNVDFQHLDNLEILNLARNGLIDLKVDVFEYLQNLRSLNLDGNRVTKLKPETFAVFKGTLSKLYMEKMDLQEMPVDVISQLSELTHLELNDNSIKEILEGAFSNLGKLTRLDMNQCMLGDIAFTTTTFSNLNSLDFLNLGFNQISEIPSGAFDAFKSTLRELYLEHNTLQTLDSELLEWGRLTTLYISENQWICDCNIKWMSDLDLTANSFPTNVTCFEPAEFKGLSLHNVTANLEDCPSGSRSSVIALAITIPIIIVCAGFIAYYLYKIIQARRTRGARKSVRYSEVYRDTVESTNKPPRPPRPVSEL